MWRAITLALSIACSSVPVWACEDPYNIQGLIYDDIPAGTPPSALVLDVVFEETTDRGPLTARVRRVVQGEYHEPTIRIGGLNSSCDYPFIFGREGLIIGDLREGVESQSYGPQDHSLVLTWGLEGTWFRPLKESVAERRDRTGVDPFARTVDATPIAGTPTASGDFDGDGAADTASFFEDEGGNLVIAVARAADENFSPIIWGGDISSLPRFAFHATPPGLYQTDCEAYGPNCGGVPRTATLTHDGIIVEGLEDHSRTLYYWSNGEFENVSIRE